MSEVVINLLHAAEELLRRGRYKDVVARLGEIDTSSISPEQKAFYSLLLADARLNIGNYQVSSELEYALDYYRNSSDNQRFGRAKYLRGWLSMIDGKYLDAREELLEAYATYKRCDYIVGQGRVLSRLGKICLQLGDVEASIENLKKCLALYDQINDNQNCLIISLNLATVYYSVGRLKKSIDLFNQISGEATSRESRFGYLYQNMAMPFALKGDTRRARSIIEKALPFIKGFPYRQSIYYENLGWICLLEGDYKNAHNALEKGLKISLEIAPESALISQIERRLGDANLGLGSLGAARKHADQALKIARKINERVEIAACHRIMGQLEAMKGNDQSAREWFKKAIDLFLLTGYRYELAVTRYLAAASGHYANGECQALLYLAGKYFEAEEIDHFLLKVNRETTNDTRLPSRTRGHDNSPPEIVSTNLEMRHLIELAANVSGSEMSVLLMGPTGTGKDLFAQFIHHQSGRRGRFVMVNAAAIPDSMTEAELFGHRKGSFTGAGYDKPGLIETADGGTLYLNEIAESSPEFQTKLLNVFESKKIRRLGETLERSVDFRLIVATNHNLDQMVRERRFRPDLYHRINEVAIELPPLCDRRGDIPELTRHFLSQAGIDVNDNEAMFDRLAGLLSIREWPGNVRQLQSEIRRLALLSDRNLAQMVAAANQHPNDRDQLIELLEETGWNRREVARRINLSETTIRRRIRQYDLTPPAK
jgi:DNA-binding NtrC family response regulator/predicted negative regulator of RcsB-dependent stress response